MSFEDAKSTVSSFKVPRGYLRKTVDDNGEETVKVYNHFNLREMDGKDEDIIMNKKINITERLYMVISNCITQVESEDGSVISDPKDLKDVVNNLLMSDITTLLIRLRQISLGDNYSFRFKCMEPDCGVTQTQVIRLSELDVYEAKGDPCEELRKYTLNDGRVVEWEMINGARDKAEALKPRKKKRNSDDPDSGGNNVKATQSLMRRLRTIDGEKVTIEKLQSLTFKQRALIRKEFDAEGGIETGIEGKCNSCGAEFTTEMQIDGGNFFSLSEADMKR